MFYITLFLCSQLSATKSADIAEAFFDREWRTCAKDSDCVIIEFGCGGQTASNKTHQKEATQRAWEKGGDPRTLNCAGEKLRHGVKCLSGLCKLVD